METSVIAGDITQVPVDAMMTGINSSGMWFGGIDAAIQRAVGNVYHDILADVLRRDRHTEVVVADPCDNDKGVFENVIFVIDDLKKSLQEVVEMGLAKANYCGFKTISMQMIRFGVMNEVGSLPDDKIAEIAKAVKAQADRADNSIEKLYVVVYGDEGLKARMVYALED